jgi:hypothetical protein
MRLAAYLVLLSLAGCGSAPRPSAGPVFPRSHGPILTPADRADPVAALRRAGAGDAMTPEGARVLFGRADIERVDGAGAMLTYRMQTCALALVFAAPNGGDLRLGAIEAAARNPRTPAPSLAQCVSEARARSGMTS